jgi:hypothetical protein
LNHEKKWVYGSLLLTVAFFIILIFIPLLTISDTIGTPINAPSRATQTAAPDEHGGH